VVPFVLYPTIGNISSISHIPQVSSPKYIGKARRSFFLSINRFERKKRLHSTIIAFGTLRNRLAVQPGQMPYLILAGGYDKSVRENVEHFHELKRYESVSLRRYESVSHFLSIIRVDWQNR